MRQKVKHFLFSLQKSVDKNEASGSVFDLIACFYFGLQYKMSMCLELNGFFVDIVAEIGQRMKKYDSIWEANLKSNWKHYIYLVLIHRFKV